MSKYVLHTYIAKFDKFRNHGRQLAYVPQFYIQLVFKAPLCITITISDQKIVSGSLFLTQKKFSQFFFKFFKFFIKQFFSADVILSKKIEKLDF